jgi:Protein of unknown function (DUF3892)
VAREIIAIRLKDGGNRPSHIVHLWWKTKDGSGAQGDGTRLELAKWIEDGGKAFVIGGGRRADVEVDTTGAGVKYVRTVPDDSKLDNLLALPKR